MSAAGRIAAFGAALTVAFAGAYAAGAAFVPDGTAASWQARSEHSDAHGPHTDGTHTDGTPAGLSLSRDGYLLAPVQAPGTPGVDGRLSFTVLGPSGAPLRDYASTHDRDMHLMVVRTDGSGFRHVHPQLDRDTGVWSLPWRWERAGTYRVFTDFQPEDTKDAPALTLSRTVEVAGAMSPTEPGPVRNASEVDGYTVTLTGDLTAGATAPLTAEFSRGGEPVTELSPYLGAFGHLVALREGDLAFLHVHPTGAEPAPGSRGGPAISFAAQAPTSGRYLLYLDFQVDGRVHTATFVVDAAAAPRNVSAENP
ncbi:MAG: heavy-metal-associated domain-containing protein [Mycolicibacterium sp.]|jgi:hypothetical protein|uniref:Heavy metal-binding domain-containing protein n=1 Tax=Mycolicibacterium insubricum TaxID=444597 RepID=A0A1X0D007_9MYCO|nr:heavy metal-binding domain-containing protein [Mycolicibacterium insubricum]MCB9439487.1 heavy-metal-associated domain-containing protein [Mycolicibacterium sp.]MCV7082666.1 heavy-metal-associated domain-containing protein [Mycolicibacterium insubricum]ORA65737.1 heavy metal-binding domain-containing protein [Mycolicibacterium insubricum]